jgi:hypothetical protein
VGVWEGQAATNRDSVGPRVGVEINVDVMLGFWVTVSVWDGVRKSVGVQLTHPNEDPVKVRKTSCKLDGVEQHEREGVEEDWITVVLALRVLVSVLLGGNEDGPAGFTAREGKPLRLVLGELESKEAVSVKATVYVRKAVEQQVELVDREGEMQPVMQLDTVALWDPTHAWVSCKDGVEFAWW